jgi:hypothetical protein
VVDRGDAHFLEAVDRQLAQHAGIDGVFPKRLFVLSQPEPAQPLSNVDCHLIRMRAIRFAEKRSIANSR